MYLSTLIINIAMAPLAKLSSLSYFLILCFFSHQSQFITSNAVGSSGEGFSFKLIHRDSPESPLYPGNLTSSEKLERLLQFSKSRLIYLHTKIAGASNYSNLGLISPPVLLDGFLYLVQVGIGYHKPYHLLLDTGSGVIWTQCVPCEPCFPQNTPTFDPSRSRTFRSLPCNPNSYLPPKFTCKDNRYEYDIKYESGKTAGYLATETFKFNSQRSVKSLPNIAFGCSINNRDMTFRGNIDGILGMDKGELSLISQMGNEAQRRFSYCLVESNAPAGTHSFLSFGNDYKLKGSNVQSTQFVPFPTLADAYGLNLLDISVGNRRCSFNPGYFAFKPDRSGGVIIDSGSATSHIPPAAFRRVVDVIKTYLRGQFTLLPSPGQTLNMCFRLNRGFTDLPSLTFHFDGPADLRVAPTNVFYYDASRGHHCLAFISSNEVKFSVIGARHQINYRMEYNLATNRLSWAPEDCRRSSHG